MKNYLLSIGIGQYANQGAELLSLGRVPANDCDRLAKVLCSELYGFELIQEPLLDEHASHDAIISALDGLTGLEEDSQLIIHFSGHGEHRTKWNMSYWLAHKAVPPSAFDPNGDLEEQGWISAEEIVKKVNAAGCRHVLILADCCYAGHMRYNYRGMGGHLFPDYAKLAIRTKSREILSPCSVTLTSSPAGDKSVSEFTKCIADKLEKKNPFAVISPPMLYGELLSHHQNPQYGHLQGVNEPGGYFLFASPERLDSILKEDFEYDDKVHQVFCSKIEQKLQPISSAIDRSRYLDGFVGRQWVFDEVTAWIADPSSRLFWLTGEPGIGKSAVSAYLAEHNEVICAHHFFLFDKAATLDLKQVTKSLAYQLAQVLPDYTNHTDQLDDKRLQELDSQSLFDDLIITPLAQVVSDPTIPIVMLLDGLDEASVNGKNEIAEYLAKLIDTAPTWLKIMFTSRTREPEINRSLGKHRPWPLDATDSRNSEDLALYLEKNLPACTTRPKLVNAIMGKSEGSFLYIKHLCDDWAQRDELPDISQLPTGLPGIYEQFFRRQFPDIEDYEGQALPVLELIIGAFEPLSIRELAEFSATSEREIQKVRRRMGSLLRELSGTLEFCHKSLRDWLTSAVDSEYCVLEQDAHKRFCEVGARQYHSLTNGRMPAYLLRYFIAHLCNTHDDRCLDQVACDLSYLQILLTSHGVGWVVQNLEAASRHFKDSGLNTERIEALLTTISGNRFFLNDNPEGLGSCVLSGMRNKRKSEQFSFNREPSIWLQNRNFSPIEPSEVLTWTMKRRMPSFYHNQEGSRIAITYANGDLDILLLEEGIKLSQNRKSIRPIISLCFSPDDENTVFFITSDTLWSWNYEANEASALYTNESMKSLANSPFFNDIAIGCDDGLVILYDPQIRKVQQTTKVTRHTVRCLDWSEDGSKLACGLGDGSVSVIQMPEMVICHHLKGHFQPIEYVVCAGSTVISFAKDRQALMWDLGSGQKLGSLDKGESTFVDEDVARAFGYDGIKGLHEIKGGLKSLPSFVSACGSKVLLGFDEGRVQIWEEGKMLKDYSYGGGLVLFASFDMANESVLIGTLEGLNKYRLFDQSSSFHPSTSRVREVVFSDEGNSFVLNFGDSLLIYSYPDKKYLAQVEISGNYIKQIRIDEACNKVMALVDDDICIWDLKKEDCSIPFPNEVVVGYYAEKDSCISVATLTSVSLYDYAKGNIIWSIPIDGAGSSACMERSGLVAVGSYKSIQLYSPCTSSQSVQKIHVDSSPMQLFPSEDEDRLLVGFSSGKIAVVDLETSDITFLPEGLSGTISFAEGQRDLIKCKTDGGQTNYWNITTKHHEAAPLSDNEYYAALEAGVFKLFGARNELISSIPVFGDQIRKHPNSYDWIVFGSDDATFSDVRMMLGDGTE